MTTCLSMFSLFFFFTFSLSVCLFLESSFDFPYYRLGRSSSNQMLMMKMKLNTNRDTKGVRKHSNMMNLVGNRNRALAWNCPRVDDSQRDLYCLRFHVILLYCYIVFFFSIKNLWSGYLERINLSFSAMWYLTYKHY